MTRTDPTALGPARLVAAVLALGVVGCAAACGGASSPPVAIPTAITKATPDLPVNCAGWLAEPDAQKQVDVPWIYLILQGTSRPGFVTYPWLPGVPLPKSITEHQTAAAVEAIDEDCTRAPQSDFPGQLGEDLASGVLRLPGIN